MVSSNLYYFRYLAGAWMGNYPVSCGNDRDQYRALRSSKSGWGQPVQAALHVTIPGILPTIVTLLILDIGGIMGSNFEKIILLYLPSTYETADVISTLVYRMGISGGNFSYATAVGLFEGVIGLILVTTANFVSKKITESSLW